MHLDPIVGGGQGQVFLAVEVVEEAAFGEPGSFADILNARGGVALGADDVESRIEEPGLRFVPCFVMSIRVLLQLRLSLYQPVGGYCTY